MQPLCRCGILGKLPMLPFALCISRDVAWNLHVALCSLSAPLVNKRPPLRLAVQHFKPPKFAPWSSLVGADSPLQQHAARHFQSGPESYIVRGFAGASVCNMPCSFELACPKCQHKTDAIHKNIYVDNKASAGRCSNCKLTCMNTRWHCGCGLPWITCQT